MNPLRHVLATLAARHRWELAGFLLLAIATAILAFSHPKLGEAFAALEWIGFHWLTLRILLSEEGFRTHGGWRARPFPRSSVLKAQLILLVSLLVSALLIHCTAVKLLLHPTAEQWALHASNLVGATLIPWLMFAGIAKLFGWLLLGRLEGRARTAAWSVLVIGIAACLSLSLRKFGASRGTWGGTTSDLENLSPGIQHALSGATDFIGMWHEPARSREVPQVRELARIQVSPTWTDNPPGVRVLELRTGMKGDRVIVDLTLQAIDPLLLEKYSNASAVLRYADGSCGMATMSNRFGKMDQRPGLTIPQAAFQHEFPSPISLPENRKTDPAKLAPVELIYFVADPELPPLPTPLDFMRWNEGPPSPPLAIPLPEKGAAFSEAVRDLIDSLCKERDGATMKTIRAQASLLPIEAMEPILAYHPWPEPAWKEILYPFLMKHAGEAQKPALLKRLELDSRLASLFIAKGWSAEAVPVLRRQAQERQTLPVEALELLARQNDPALSTDLAALAIRLNRGIDKLAPVLRESPGFDWPAFVAVGWKNRKYGNYDSQAWHYAAWAAKQGDASALRQLAEEAAAGKKWESAQLAQLVEAGQDELLAFLRSNLEQLRFDPASGKWQR